MSSCTPAARNSCSVSASRPSSVTIASRSSARAIVNSEARPNLFESISPIVRAAFALRDVDHVRQRAPGGRQPGVERDPGRRAERELEVQPGQEVGRPAPGEQPHVLVELARRDDHEDPLVLQLVGDRGRVRDQRQLGRGLGHELARQRQAGGRGVEEDRRARAHLARRVRGDRGLRAAVDGRALLPARGRDRGRRAGAPASPARRRGRARPARPSRELLEVAVDRDRGDGQIARQVGDRDAAVALDALEDLRAAQGGRRRCSYAVLERSLADLHVEAAGTRRSPAPGGRRSARAPPRPSRAWPSSGCRSRPCARTRRGPSGS